MVFLLAFMVLMVALTHHDVDVLFLAGVRVKT
jgi:hypothetical protein